MKKRILKSLSFVLMLCFFIEIGGFTTEGVKAAPSKNKEKEFREAIEPYREIVQNEYYKQTNTEDMVDKVIKKANDKSKPEDLVRNFVKELKDPYSEFFTEKELKSFNSSMKGEYYGIGVQVSKDKKTGGIIINEVFEGSPAEEAGLKKNDVIIQISEKKVTKMELQNAIKLIKGEKGSKVKIIILRKSKKKPVSKVFWVERREVVIPTVKAKFHQKEKIGYIKVSSFLEHTDESFITELDKFEKEKIKGLIVDLRDNGGGYVDVAKNMLNRILPDGEKLYSFEYKGGIKEGFNSGTVEGEEDKTVEVPIVILMNKFSASASEIFAGVLKDNGVAEIFGEKSFGKGVAQSVYPVNGSLKGGIKLTVLYYYLPLGESIHEKGIKPDKELTSKKDKKGKIDDIPLKKALKYFE